MLFNGSVRIYIKLRGKRLQFVLCKKIINNGYKIHCIREFHLRGESLSSIYNNIGVRLISDIYRQFFLFGFTQ